MVAMSVVEQRRMILCLNGKCLVLFGGSDNRLSRTAVDHEITEPEKIEDTLARLGRRFASVHRPVVRAAMHRTLNEFLMTKFGQGSTGDNVLCQNWYSSAGA
jgi:hypothetical protein